MRSRNSVLGVAAVLVFCFCGQSFGSIIAQYRVSSTSVINGQDKDGVDAPHGLWTAGDSYGSTEAGNNYYDIQGDMLFTQYDNGTATLIGSAMNPYGTVASISLSYGSFLSAVANPADYKKEGGLAYDPAEHDFYDTVSGTIEFAWGSNTETVNIARYVGSYKFQLGLGANAKSTTEFGGSSWIQDADNASEMGSDHWDLNLQFSAVPEPTAFAVWSLMLAALVPFRRRRDS